MTSQGLIRECVIQEPDGLMDNEYTFPYGHVELWADFNGKLNVVLTFAEFKFSPLPFVVIACFCPSPPLLRTR